MKISTITLAALLAALPALPASAMSPAAESILKDLGLDPKSEEITSLAGDKVETKGGVVTLDSLAATGDVQAVKAFLVTREFFHAFRENWDIEFPNDERYDVRYLTETEKVFMAKKLMEGYPASSSSAASSLQPATASFLKELGMDPRSSEIRAVASDSVTTASGKVKTLDSLAAKRDETGIKSFIATRSFIRAFEKDSKADFPDDELYNILYLTSSEKAYIAAKLKEAFPKPVKQ